MKKIYLFSLFTLLVFSMDRVFAYIWQQPLHYVFSVSTGTSTSFDLGQSQYFPIQNAVTDEFYDYSGNHASQTSSLLGGFWGAEWLVASNWLWQSGVDYTQNSAYTVSGRLTQGADELSQDSYAYHYNVTTKQLLAEQKIIYTGKPCFQPYFLVALGASFNNAYHFYTNVPPFLTFTREYQNNSTSSFSYALGVGVDIHVHTHLRFGVGYRFADLGRVELGNATIDGTNVSGTLSQSHLYANQLLAQLTVVS